MGEGALMLGCAAVGAVGSVLTTPAVIASTARVALPVTARSLRRLRGGWVGCGQPAGEFAQRGGVVDVFEQHLPVPFRLAYRQPVLVVLSLGQAAAVQQAQAFTDLGDAAHRRYQAAGEQRAGGEREDAQRAPVPLAQWVDAEPVQSFGIPLGCVGQRRERLPVIADQGGGLAQTQRLAVDGSDQPPDVGHLIG